jgi:transposase
MSSIRFVGLDVHAETISAAVAEANGEVRPLETIANHPEALAKLLRKLGPAERLRACYEAGPTGYGVYWELAKRGVHCDVIAPSLIPVRRGDRVKTDRRDACKLARSYRSGDLTAVRVPDESHEALRDLVRAREAAVQDLLRARNRLQKFLLRHSRRSPERIRPWTAKYMIWVKALCFPHSAQEATLIDYIHEIEHAQERIERLERAIDTAIEKTPQPMRSLISALQAMRGVAKLTAVTIVAELGTFSRFAHPKLLMGYSGLVASEHSSGARIHRAGITKTGNAHLRRILVEAAWTYRHRPTLGDVLKRRQKGLSAEVKEIAWKAQHRLYRRFLRLLARGKLPQQAVVAVARELVGFIWAIGVQVEKLMSPPVRTILLH